MTVEVQIPCVTPTQEKDARYGYTLFHGAVLLAEGKIDSAILISSMAVGSRPYSWSSASMAFYSYVSFYPPFRDVSARAYLMKGNITEAIAEYERLTTFSPKLEDRRLISPEYHYYLAKLYEPTGEKEKAIQRYEKFLHIWESADADITELIDAKARLGKLKGGK